jgi:transposase
LVVHSDRLTAAPLPAYAPDDHPIEDLWKKTQKRATHNEYRKECAALTVSGDPARAYFATHLDTV